MASSFLAFFVFLLLLVLLGPFQSADAMTPPGGVPGMGIGIVTNPAGILNSTNSGNAITRLVGPSTRVSFRHGVGPPATGGSSSINSTSSKDQRNPKVVARGKRVNNGEHPSHSDREDPNRHNKQQIDALFELLKPKKPAGMSQANWENALETTRHLMEMMPYAEAKVLANNGGVTNFLSALGKKSQIVEHSDWLKKLDEDLREIKEKNANLVDGGDRLLVAGIYALLMRHSLNQMKSGLWAILGITADDPHENRRNVEAFIDEHMKNVEEELGKRDKFLLGALLNPNAQLKVVKIKLEFQQAHELLKHMRDLLAYFGNFRGWHNIEQYIQAELMKAYTMKLHHNKVPDKGQLAQAAKEELKRMEAEKQQEQSEGKLENNEAVDAKGEKHPSEDDEEGMDVKEQEQLDWQNNRGNELGKRRK